MIEIKEIQSLFDVLMSEIGCSENLKNVLLDFLENRGDFIGNSYEIKVDNNDYVLIENLYNDKEKYKLNKEKFVEIIEEFFKKECD